MFCPNCGKDCGSAKFCTGCGTKIEENAGHSGAWSVGQPCPHCGGTKLDGDHCAFCGAQLVVAGSEENVCQEDSYEIPYRKFYVLAAGVHMHIAKEFVTITKKVFFSKNVIRIPYNRLKEVVFCRDELTHGSITFRWCEGAVSDSNLVESSQLEEYTLKLGSGEQCTLYFHVFHLFRILAPEARFTTQVPLVDQRRLQEYGSIMNLDEYFIRFTPYRKRAVSAIKGEQAISDYEAKELVNALFNQKQNELYAADPSLAARDYNRRMKEINRIFEEEDRERLERAQRWR